MWARGTNCGAPPQHIEAYCSGVPEEMMHSSVAALVFVLLACSFATGHAAGQREAAQAAANPIRKVVTMLQNMQKKVPA